MKRLITKRQEQALRLCHHDFEGLTQEDAAEKMGISRQAINRLLTAVKKVMPQYFPILTKHEAKIYHYYMIEGWEVGEITEYMELSQSAVYKALQRTKDKGMYFSEAKGRVLQYESDMDASVKQRF